MYRENGERSIEPVVAAVGVIEQHQIVKLRQAFAQRNEVQGDGLKTVRRHRSATHGSE